MSSQDEYEAWLQQAMRPETDAQRLQREVRDFDKARNLVAEHGGDWSVNGKWAFEPPKQSWSEAIFGVNLGF